MNQKLNESFGAMGEFICSTELIAQAIRNYAGVRRKSDIGEMVRSLRIDSPDVVASFGEDAAVLHNDGQALLLAADGIWNQLMDADPYWAGYCAVLVNIHDIAAMGGKPLAMVDVLSISDETNKTQVIKGMHDASVQFGVPIVGGHLHPDTPYSVIDVAILGVADPQSIIYSSTALTDDLVVVAIDLNGKVHPSSPLNWDSVSSRTPQEVRSQIAVMERLGKEQLVTAGKDISNPGILGTLGMLLEVSEKGACIDLEKIPRPDLSEHNISFEHWVRMYPGMGFILTVKPENFSAVQSIFESVQMTTHDIGKVTESRTLSITYNGETTEVFDFRANGGIMHLEND